MKKNEYDFIDDQGDVIVIHDDVFPIYIIKGDKNFLIDTGTTAKAIPFHTKINRILTETGNGKNNTIHSLLLTHSHWDHTGSASYLQDQYHFDVYASHRAVEVLQKDKVVSFINRLNQDYKSMVNDKSNTSVKKLTNLHPLKEGDKIKVSTDSYLEIIETPGHTKCSISYLLHPQKILFPGDCTGVIEQDNSIKPIFLSSYKEYEHSEEKLLTLDVEALGFPHNPVIKGKKNVETHFHRALNRTREIKDKIIRLLNNGKETIEIAEILLLEDFSKPTLAGPKESMIINFEAMAKTVKRELME
ncbi:MAG: MBL fold metallo-hydrolase [bacterium]|nr:MBL fold metallo-hydrolase [bacterium]